MGDALSVVALVARAAGGDQRAWNEVAECYAPLMWSICARCQLSRHDAEDVGQTVWLLLVEQLGKLREPAALPGWLATTIQRECLRVVTAARRSGHLGSKLKASLQREDSPAIEQEIIVAERNAGLRAAFAALPPACRKLLSVLSVTRPAHTPRSARRWRSGSGVSARSADVAWNVCAKSKTLIAFGGARSPLREVSPVIDDEQLLAALREAVRAGEAVPSWFVETGKDAYAWHNVDAELAQLTYGSGADAELSAAGRSETASIRALTFTSSRLSMELEAAERSLLGQIVPLRAGTLETHTKAGVTTSPVDETGCFALDPKPVSPFRLRFRTTDGVDVVTGWITL